MVIIEESMEAYNIVILIASAKAYITKKQLSNLKEIANAYKREAEEYVKRSNSEGEDEDVQSIYTNIGIRLPKKNIRL